jgi:hypothetical protein
VPAKGRRPAGDAKGIALAIGWKRLQDRRNF